MHLKSYGPGPPYEQIFSTVDMRLPESYPEYPVYQTARKLSRLHHVIWIIDDLGGAHYSCIILLHNKIVWHSYIEKDALYASASASALALLSLPIPPRCSGHAPIMGWFKTICLTSEVRTKTYFHFQKIT